MLEVEESWRVSWIWRLGLGGAGWQVQVGSSLFFEVRLFFLVTWSGDDGVVVWCVDGIDV